MHQVSQKAFQTVKTYEEQKNSTNYTLYTIDLRNYSLLSELQNLQPGASHNLNF